MDTPSSVELTTNEVRAGLADVLHAAAVQGRITYVTNRGRRVAAIVPLAIAEDADSQG